MPDDHCVVKPNFTNAFSSLHRDIMLNAVLKKAPGIYKFCHLSHDNPSELVYSSCSIHSRESQQQRDPPITTIVILRHQSATAHLLGSSVNMDDVTVEGPHSQVVERANKSVYSSTRSSEEM